MEGEILKWTDNVCTTHVKVLAKSVRMWSCECKFLYFLLSCMSFSVSLSFHPILQGSRELNSNPCAHLMRVSRNPPVLGIPFYMQNPSQQVLSVIQHWIITDPHLCSQQFIGFQLYNSLYFFLSYANVNIYAFLSA